MINQMGFEEVELTSRSDCPPGSTAAKAIIKDELNDWAKKEAKNRGLTAGVFLGQLLEASIHDEQNSAKTKEAEQLRQLFGDDWKDVIQKHL